MTEHPRPLPGGKDHGRAPSMPDSLTTACTCIRCRLAAVHGDLLRLACDLPEPFEHRAVAAADIVFDLIRHDPPADCLVLVDLLQRIEAEAVTVSGILQGVRLRKIADDLKTYSERFES